MQFKYYIIGNLEYLEEWENGERIKAITQPFCESVLKLVNDDDMLSGSALGLYARNFFLYWVGEQELDKAILQTLIPALHIVIEIIDQEPVEVLYAESINEIMFYIIIKTRQKIAEKRLWIIRCNRCQRVFPNFKHGRSVLYCNFKNDNGESCRDIIKQNAEGWNKSDREKELQKTYIRYYDEQRRKRRKKLVTKEQIAIWSKNARAVRDKCKKGEITEGDFVKWLNENKENYMKQTE